MRKKLWKFEFLFSDLVVGSGDQDTYFEGKFQHMQYASSQVWIYTTEIKTSMYLWSTSQEFLKNSYIPILFKEIEIIHRLFLVIAMYICTVKPVQASSMNH